MSLVTAKTSENVNEWFSALSQQTCECFGYEIRTHLHETSEPRADATRTTAILAWFATCYPLKYWSTLPFYWLSFVDNHWYRVDTIGKYLFHVLHVRQSKPEKNPAPHQSLSDINRGNLNILMFIYDVVRIPFERVEFLALIDTTI